MAKEAGASAPTIPAPPRTVPPTIGPPPAADPQPTAGPSGRDLSPVGASEASVALSLFFPHLLVAGHCSTVRLRLTNHSAGALQNIEVTLDSCGLSATGIGRRHRLEAGQTTELLLEITPSSPGHFVLRAGVSAETAARPCSWRGSHTLPVHQAPDPHIQIHIGDIQSNLGANAGLGADYGNVQLSNLLGGANLKTLNDLLALELPEIFTPLALDPDYEWSLPAVSRATAAHHHPLRLPEAFCRSAQPGGCCVLHATTGDAREIRLVARSRFRLGRSRTDADFVTWFWPRDPAHDQRTQRLSKVHVELRADAGGIFVWDAHSANGTHFDGQPLGRAGEKTARLGPHAQLLLAGDYKLDLDHLGANSEDRLRITDEECWPGPSATPAPHRGCIRFRPHNTESSPPSTVWLFTDAAIGSSPANALVLPDADLAEIQGRFLFYRGCFWLENTAPNDRVTVDGYPLARGELVPLVNGSKVRLGRTTWEARIDE